MSRTDFRRTARRVAVTTCVGLLALGCAADRGDRAEEIAGTVLMPEAGSPFVAFDVWVKVGSQNDPQGKEGLAALTASLLADGGTTEDGYQQILERLYPMATGYFAVTDKEMTTFRGVVHRDNLEEYYRLFKNAVLSPAFAQEDFERVKSQTMNFLQNGRRFQRDEELSKELLFWRLYRGTSYEHPEEGYVRSVESITLEDVEAFYRDHYKRGSVVVGLGGGYPEGFARRARADFDALPEGTVAPVPPSNPAMPEGVKVVLVEKDTDASAISFGYPLDVVRGDQDYYALYLANTWLGDHRNSFSHLYQVIRERRGMNYGDYSYVEAFPLGFTTQERPVNVSRRSQIHEIWIRPISLTEPGNLHDRTLFAIRAAWRELDKLVDDGLPGSEVERAKTYLYNFAVTFGSTALRRLAYAVDDGFYGLEGPGFLEQIRPTVQALTAEQVNAAIGEHFQTENMVLVVITRDAETFKKKLLAGEKTLISYAGEQPPEILAEDQEIATFPIPVKEEDVEILDILEVFEGEAPAAEAGAPTSAP
ncbi:MAG TPA: pitrilysin family protein [Thermoanaerobaculia bacterium]|nr:pitrilysin family protein [Thermoanaerobaculia bacterium]